MNKYSWNINSCEFPAGSSHHPSWPSFYEYEHLHYTHTWLVHFFFLPPATASTSTAVAPSSMTSHIKLGELFVVGLQQIIYLSSNRRRFRHNYWFLRWNRSLVIHRFRFMTSHGVNFQTHYIDTITEIQFSKHYRIYHRTHFCTIMNSENLEHRFQHRLKTSRIQNCKKLKLIDRHRKPIIFKLSVVIMIHVFFINKTDFIFNYYRKWSKHFYTL